MLVISMDTFKFIIILTLNYKQNTYDKSKYRTVKKKFFVFISP